MSDVVVIGDALLDRDLNGIVERLCPEAPVPVVEGLTQQSRPGGAGLAAALAAADGREVVLVTALARDAAGRELHGLLAQAGVTVVDLGITGPTPEKVRVRTEGRLLVRLDHGDRRVGTIGAVTSAALDALERAAVVLVCDYGRGVSALPPLREAIAERARDIPVVWDPHSRGAAPVPGVRLATPNRDEAAVFEPAVTGGGLRGVAERAHALRARWRCDAVAVTLAANGVVMVGRDAPAEVFPAPPVVGGDACGAGDAFASTAALLLADRATPTEAVAGAVACASAFVAAGGAGSFSLERDGLLVDESPEAEDVAALVAGVRARGGTVVATGGCFDLLHAGHVATLDGARALGDCLIVCLNSDESVRRFKGSDRPLVSEADRAAVLRALSCVDAVVVFDDDTPEAVLERIRPDVWVKGGDYAVDELPEAAVVARWGGQVLILPTLPGRSTTSLIEEAIFRGGR